MTVMTPARTNLGPFQRSALVAVVTAGPLSIAILRGILPYSTVDDTTEIATKIAQHQTAQTLTLWLSLIAMATLLPGVIAVGLLALRHARILGGWGLALAAAGFSQLWAIIAVDFAALSAADSGLGIPATVSLLDELSTHPVQLAATAMFILGHIIGTILLGVALLRSHAIPSWTAWALIISQPFHLVFAVIIPNNALDAAAWTLTTIGFAAAALTLAKPGQSATQTPSADQRLR